MKIGKNDPCPCGSGKKYKDCCFENNLGYKLHLKGKKAENFVYQLSQKTFLTDWCYQSPKLPNGKEICDLLIIFDNVAIIWQIKDLKIDKNGHYNETEVKKNLNQLSTARKRLFEKKLDIELENPRRGMEKLDSSKITEIYQISALLGKGEDYYSGMEFVDSKLVHTFTREFTEVALTELDTISDFVEYLREKERLYSNTNIKIIVLGGEKEELAYYLMNQRSFKKFEKNDVVLFQDGIWDELQKRPEYIRKRKEDEISYGWDEIINRAHQCGKKYEVVARELARLNRFDRRIMSKTFYDAHVLAHNAKTNVFRRLVEMKGTTFCFLFFDDPEPRTTRRSILEMMCFIARGLRPKNELVIGIATEMKIRPWCSYDFCYLFLPKWNAKNEKQMKELQEKTGIFKNINQKNVHEDEYPVK